MLPAALLPTLSGDSPDLCRLSPDQSFLAMALGKEIYIAFTEDPQTTQLIAAFDGQVADLAWSGDGQMLACTITSGPPPGEVRIGVLPASGGAARLLPGMSFVFAEKSPTLLIADPQSKRLYLHDLQLDIQHGVAPLEDDGDPHFPPALSISPDAKRIVFSERSVNDGVTRAFLAHHDGARWKSSLLTEVPGTALRILPFWSADGASLALYMIDLQQHHSAIVAVPTDDQSRGDILYTSDSLDAVVTPAAHPDGRLIALVRAHPKQDEPTLVENRLVLLDPAEHAVAPLASSSEVIGNLRWLDARTLLVEGRGIWTIKVGIEERAPQAAGGYVQTGVAGADEHENFSIELPAGWKRQSLPDVPVDFDNPLHMKPLALFAPDYATLAVTISTRPVIADLSLEEMLRELSAAQELQLGPITQAIRPIGQVVHANATQQCPTGPLRFQLILTRRGNWLYSIVAMSAAPLWEAMSPALMRILDSVAPAE